MAARPVLRHISSINDLLNSELDSVFALAEANLKQLSDPERPHSISRSKNTAPGRVLATVFMEPSTRTRLSFESAMHRLGGSVITSADPATSSSAKGESLADTVRVVSSYADVIVLRHPRDGAARYAADFADIPLVNAGDGSHEHPTQTLCDLFTLKQQHKSLKGLNVAISGDLRGSRTIHSFVYALARLKANLVVMPAKGMELPAHVDARLRDEFGLQMLPKESHSDDKSIDALYVTPDEPHQQSLFASPAAELGTNIDPRLENVDVVYVTRFQKERWAEASGDAYPKVDRQFLASPKYRKSSVMHPLPRVGELDVELDSDARAAYFRQAAYGVPVRMALLELILGLGEAPRLQRFPGGFREQPGHLYEKPRGVGIACSNANCVVHEPSEAPYVRNRFYYLHGDRPLLRCAYCDHDIADVWFASPRTGKYQPSSGPEPSAADVAEFTAFASAEAADAAGFARADAAPSRRQKGA